MAIVVNSDASAFKRTANLPTSSSFTMWAWVYVGTDRNTFTGALALADSAGGSPSTFFQVATESDGLIFNFYYGGTNYGSLITTSTSNWYFMAMRSSGTASGSSIAYARALTSNTLSSRASNTTTTGFTTAAAEWGRDGFTGDYLDGRIHACGMSDVGLSVDELLEISYFHEPQLDGLRSVNVFYPCIADTAANCQVDKSGNGRNATATPGALADSPALLWRAIPPSYTLPAGAASGAITGAVALTITPTGTLTGAGALIGAVPLSITPVGALTGAGALIGAIPLSLTPSGVLTGAGALVGSVPLSFTPVGVLTGNGALTGAVSITLNITGALTDSAATGAITGAVGLTLAMSGVLTGAGALAGVTAMTIGITGALSDTTPPAPVVSPVVAAGSSSQRKRRYYVEIDGQQFPVDSADQATQLLHQARALAEREAEAKVSVAVKRLASKPRVPVVRVPPPVITASPELDLSPLIADIERLYAKAAQTAELRLLLAKQMADEDDEDDVLLLI